MKSVVFGLLASTTLMTSTTFASSTFVCQFLKTSHLTSVKMTLDATKASLQIKSSDGADPIGLAEGGESAFLERREQGSQDWLGYDGSNCEDKTQDPCTGFSRGFSLNFPKAGLTASGSFSAELQMTQMSGYIPGATFHSYSLECLKAKK